MCLIWTSDLRSDDVMVMFPLQSGPTVAKLGSKHYLVVGGIVLLTIWLFRCWGARIWKIGKYIQTMYDYILYIFDHIWILYSICMFLHEYTCKYWCVQKLGDISPLVECCWFFYICCHVEAKRMQGRDIEIPKLPMGTSRDLIQSFNTTPWRRLAHWRRASEAHASWQISVGIDVASMNGQLVLS